MVTPPSIQDRRCLFLFPAPGRAGPIPPGCSNPPPLPIGTCTLRASQYSQRLFPSGRKTFMPCPRRRGLKPHSGPPCHRPSGCSDAASAIPAARRHPVSMHNPDGNGGQRPRRTPKRAFQPPGRWAMRPGRPTGFTLDCDRNDSRRRARVPPAAEFDLRLMRVIPARRPKVVSTDRATWWIAIASTHSIMGSGMGSGNSDMPTQPFPQ